MSSLENKLETACALLMRRAEPMLATGSPAIRLASAHLNQPVDPAAKEDENAAQIPVPDVLLTAERGQETPPDSDIYPVTLTVAVSDNAQHGSEDGFLESLYAAATRLFRYELVPISAQTGAPSLPLPAALSQAVDGLDVLSTPQEITGAELEVQGSVVTRRASAVFYCRLTS